MQSSGPMDWEEIAGMACGETFINPKTRRRAMENYPYVLAENLNVGSIDGITVRLRLPYVLSSKWRKLARKLMRMDRINTDVAYVW
jgi:hypothetical protein